MSLGFFARLSSKGRGLKGGKHKMRVDKVFHSPPLGDGKKRTYRSVQEMFKEHPETEGAFDKKRWTAETNERVGDLLADWERDFERGVHDGE